MNTPLSPVVGMPITGDSCPACTCPFWKATRNSTADMPDPWQDTDGTWYCGPFKTTEIKHCAHCGWSMWTEYERGKKVSEGCSAIPLAYQYDSR